MILILKTRLYTRLLCEFNSAKSSMLIFQSTITFGEKNLRKFLKEYTEHYHFERNHQGIENEFIESENNILKQSQSGNGNIVKKENEAMMAKFGWLDQSLGRVHGCTKQLVLAVY